MIGIKELSTAIAGIQGAERQRAKANPKHDAILAVRAEIFESLIYVSDVERCRKPLEPETAKAQAIMMARRSKTPTRCLAKAVELATEYKLKTSDQSPVTWWDVDEALRRYADANKKPIPAFKDNLLPSIKYPELWTSNVQKFALTYAKNELERDFGKKLKIGMEK